jgi:hypothetical protein
MADYYINFSFIVELPTEAARSYAIDLAAKAAAYDWDDKEDWADFPVTLAQDLRDLGFVEWYFETEETENGVWVHAYDGGDGPETACVFVKHLLQEFNPDGRVDFQWACDCSKAQPDVFGGGAAIVTAREFKTLWTNEWVAKQLQEIQKASGFEREG